MNLITRFIQYIKKENLFQPKDRLLLAVSGGVDSVVLCEMCKQAGFDFAIAHCNFQLRGEESERDEQFVKNLGAKYNVPVFIKKFDTERFAKETRQGIQEAARNLRYAWFLKLWQDKFYEDTVIEDEIADRINRGHAPEQSQRLFVATAHHANDNIETLLMNFFKGTGIKGLQGILPAHGIANYLVRPLLFAKKEELKQFAEENKLLYVEDSSNSSDKYTRNYFRNQLIPSLQKVFPEVEDNLVHNLERFREIEDLYRQSIERHKKALLEQKGNELWVPVLKLKKIQPLYSVLYEIIKDFGFSPQQVSETIGLLDSESGKYIQSSSHRIIKNRNWIIIASIQPYQSGIILIEEDVKSVDMELGNLTIKLLPNSQSPIPDSLHTACFDAGEIKFPLVLRKWKQGDYFYPLGMPKKKKLSRFFIDQKLSKTAKEKVWVIEMDKKIVWIVNHRIDDRIKITAKTKQVLLLTLHPAL